MGMLAFLLIALLLYRPAMLIGNYGNATSLSRAGNSRSSQEL